MKNESRGTIGEESEGVSSFLVNNRKPLVIGLISAILLCVGFVVTLTVLDYLNNKAIADLEPFIERFEKILQSKEYAELSEAATAEADVPPSVENAESAETSAADEGETIDAFISDMTGFAEKHSGYPGAEAWSLIAHLEAKRKRWAEAETAYLQAAAAGKKTHLAPVCYFNAAVAAEEQGKREDAIAQYRASLGYEDFSQAAHAQFAVGRLYEEAKDTGAALEAYQAVIDKWPKAENWTALAHRQIIALDILKKESAE
jgi:tetratricopeptide (TPR) repeat protein